MRETVTTGDIESSFRKMNWKMKMTSENEI